VTKRKTSKSLDELIGARLRVAVNQETDDVLSFRDRLAPFVRKAWSRQTLYDARGGTRKFRVTDLVAIARATGKPVHFFLDAAAEGFQKVELPGTEPIDADELLNLFRKEEPRDMTRDMKVALASIEDVMDELATQARELDEAARLINRTGWADLKAGRIWPHRKGGNPPKEGKQR
jgi:hypothetical protein